LGGAAAGVLQGDGADVAALQVQIESRSPGAPPQANRDVASPCSHVEDTRDARRDRASQVGELRPEDAVAVAEEIDARQVPQGMDVPVGAQIRLIHDLRTAMTLTDRTHRSSSCPLAFLTLFLL